MATSGLPHFKKSPHDLSCTIDACYASDTLWPARSSSDLQLAAAAGCQSCSLLLCSINTLFPTSLSRTWRWQHRCGAVFIRFPEEEKDYRLRMPFTQLGAQKSSLPWIRVRRLRPKRRTTDEYLPVLVHWLDDCTTNHDCRKSETPLPTRVLDIGLTPFDSVRLYTTSRESARYIAFSHCWGKGQISQITTTTQNFDSKTKGIPENDLPKSYLEVIGIARNLNIRYVWIDSLCIIQNDKDDWEFESGAMAATYNNAYLVVGASCAPDSSEGFIASSLRDKPTMSVATVENDDGTSSQIYTQEQDNHASHSTFFNDPRNILGSRGWTLQEQVLSSRMVHFERNELFWECRAVSVCECIGLYKSGNEQGFKKTLEIQAGDHTFQFWHFIVFEYLQRSLTYKSDFLPALSGVVTRLQEFGAGEYLAGLWKVNLVYELLWGFWKCPSGESGFIRSQPYRAPTWSWASLQRSSTGEKGYVDFRDFRYRQSGNLQALSRILHASCSPSGHDRNGAVRSGEIHIEGKLLAFRFADRKADDSMHLELASIRDWALPAHVATVEMKTHFDLGDSKFEGVKLCGLLMGREELIFNTHFPCIILHEIPDEEHVFERVGVWEVILRSSLDLREIPIPDLFARVPDTRITIV